MLARIAVDSSSLISFLSGAAGRDVDLVKESIEQDVLFLPPAAMTEVMSARKPESSLVRKVNEIPLLSVYDGYWERAGILRSLLLQNSRKARLGDTLIAQSCIDHDMPLITRDADFRHFAEFGRLKLAC